MRRVLPRQLYTCPFALAFLFLGVGHAATIDFEGLADSTILTNQYPDLTFTNAIVLSAGIGINEFEFPPHSGTNVASDNNGPMTIVFSAPITSFSGYFTYAEPLTLDGFDASDTEVANAVSAYSSNDALVGDPGSSPNEFLSLNFSGGMSSVTITGDPAGGSFVMDDMTYATTTTVPEPATSLLFAVGMTSVLILRKLFI
jgi:hypothetical protein